MRSFFKISGPFFSFLTLIKNQLINSELEYIFTQPIRHKHPTQGQLNLNSEFTFSLIGRPVYSTIYPLLKGEYHFLMYIRAICSGFEHVLPRSFPTTVAITSRVTLKY